MNPGNDTSVNHFMKRFINNLQPITRFPFMMMMNDVPTLNQSYRNDGGSTEAE